MYKSLFLFLSLVISGNPVFSTDIPKEPKKVAITQFIPHQSLDDTRRGINDGLKEAGYDEATNLKILFENAHGSSLTAAQIGNKFRGLKPDVMVGISTPSAQALVRIAKDAHIPLVFGAVSDPVSARLIGGEGLHGGVTGASDVTPIVPLLQRMRDIFPEAKTIGVIYSAGESNSVAQLEIIKKNAPNFGFIVVDKSIARSTDAQAAFDALANKAEIIYTPADNLLVSCIDTLVQRSLALKKPFIGPDSNTVKRGCLMAIGVDYYQQGKLVAQQIASILGGQKADDLKVLTQDHVEFYLNKKTADEMQIGIKPEIVEKANQIFG